MESAMTSRLISEERIPSVPIVIPSEMAIVENCIGVPPAWRTPASAAAASSRWLKLHGMVEVHECATPTIGRSSASRVYPMPYKNDLAPARWNPSYSARLGRSRPVAASSSGIASLQHRMSQLPAQPRQQSASSSLYRPGTPARPPQASGIVPAPAQAVRHQTGAQRADRTAPLTGPTSRGLTMPRPRNRPSPAAEPGGPANPPPRGQRPPLLPSSPPRPRPPARDTAPPRPPQRPRPSPPRERPHHSAPLWATRVMLCTPVPPCRDRPTGRCGYRSVRRGLTGLAPEPPAGPRVPATALAPVVDEQLPQVVRADKAVVDRLRDVIADHREADQRANRSTSTSRSPARAHRAPSRAGTSAEQGTPAASSRARTAWMASSRAGLTDGRCT